ncbi:MAG TPA: hypothetical protein DCE11_06905, partial [Ruminiclostridium sp.]|nr:hypothetical protein [Ruminiclostridium sp.]
DVYKRQIGGINEKPRGFGIEIQIITQNVEIVLYNLHISSPVIIVIFLCNRLTSNDGRINISVFHQINFTNYCIINLSVLSLERKFFLPYGDSNSDLSKKLNGEQQ